jgi:hypothetical protein
MTTLVFEKDSTSREGRGIRRVRDKDGGVGIAVGKERGGKTGRGKKGKRIRKSSRNAELGRVKGKKKAEAALTRCLMT